MWFATSDLHVSHLNIIEYAGRPFTSVPHMNTELVRRWNAKVSDGDTVYVLGDFAMGKIAESLPIAGQLNGTKILILGNHDRPFPTNKNTSRWFNEYAKYFDEIKISDTIEYDGVTFDLNHFPYQGDSHDSDRFEAYRPVDNGNWLLHGHVHSRRKVCGERMIHVGVDAWDFAPASFDEILTLTRGSNA